jgi:hypothetical protein
VTSHMGGGELWRAAPAMEKEGASFQPVVSRLLERSLMVSVGSLVPGVACQTVLFLFLQK